MTALSGKEREKDTQRCILGLPQEISCIWREIPRSATIDANVMMHKSLIVSSRDVGSDTWSLLLSLSLSQTPQIMPIAHVWTETWQLHKNLWHTQFPSSRYWFNFLFIFTKSNWKRDLPRRMRSIRKLKSYWVHYDDRQRRWRRWWWSKDKRELWHVIMRRQTTWKLLWDAIKWSGCI